MRHSRSITILALLVLASCSWYRDLERSLVMDDEKQQKHAKTVAREQYDQLLVKYEELSKKYEELKEGGPNGPSLVDELQKSQGENFARPAEKVETETVDVFATGESVQPSAPADLESQIALYRQGLALKGSNAGEATKIFQQLENNAVPPIKARSKLQIGEMLLQKQQYDLALQVFEDIIGNHAHSAAVLDALRYAIVSCEKLGITNKKEQYTSMLNDVFEMK